MTTNNELGTYQGLMTVTVYCYLKAENLEQAQTMMDKLRPVTTVEAISENECIGMEWESEGSVTSWDRWDIEEYSL